MSAVSLYPQPSLFSKILCVVTRHMVTVLMYLMHFSSRFQWLHKAVSTRYATAVCLVCQLTRCSAWFCSPFLVHEEAVHTPVSCRLPNCR